MELELLEVGKQYKSAEDFRNNNLPKYLIAKRKVLLKTLYPEHLCRLPLNYRDPRTILRPYSEKSGIYFLYEKDIIVYIGKSKNIAQRLLDHRVTKNYDKVITYNTKTEADMHSIENYLINIHKPKYNTDGLSTDSQLTFEIPNIDEILGKPSIHLPKLQTKV